LRAMIQASMMSPKTLVKSVSVKSCRFSAVAR
jgi:hypothetical protein